MSSVPFSMPSLSFRALLSDRALSGRQSLSRGGQGEPKLDAKSLQSCLRRCKSGEYVRASPVYILVSFTQVLKEELFAKGVRLEE